MPPRNARNPLHRGQIVRGSLMIGKMPLRIVCLSDTHGYHDKLEVPDGGDILIHAGDISGRGGRGSVPKFEPHLPSDTESEKEEEHPRKEEAF